MILPVTVVNITDMWIIWLFGLYYNESAFTQGVTQKFLDELF